MKSTVNIGQLLSASLSLSRQAGAIIRSVRASGNLQTFQKGVDDPCTVADTRSQELIVKGLRSVWPGLCVVGEEDESVASSSSSASASQEAPPALDLVDGSLVPEELRAVALEDVAVFLDPLDATKEFTNGVLVCVMTLVGICVRGDPVAGVMNQVFAGDSGRAVYGMRGVGVLGLEAAKRAPAHEGKFVAVTTASHSTPALDKVIEAVAPDVLLREGGCGYKTLLVMQGVVDTYLYPQPGTNRWDTCAPEALLRLLHGELTDMHGKRIVYDGRSARGTHKNASVIASRTQNIHKRVIAALEKHKE